MSHCDVQSERAVIGAVLNGATRQQVFDVVPEDFSDEKLRFIWEAIERLFQQGQAVDHLTLAESLKVAGRLVEAGGPAGIMALDDVGRIVYEANLRQQVAVLKDRTARRRLAAIGKRAEAMTYDLNVRPDRIAAEMATAFMGSSTSSGFETGDVDAFEVMDRWQAYANGATPPYLEMPHAAFEGVFKGVESNLNVFAGRSGNFKTGLAADCAWYWSMKRTNWRKGCLFGFEDGTAWLVERQLARYLDIRYEDVACSRLTEWQEQKCHSFMEQYLPLMRERLIVHRGPGLAAKDLIARVNRAIDVDGVGYVIIDHGLRVKYVDAGSRERYDQAIGFTMDALAEKGRTSNVPIIVLWHLNRSSEEEEVPTRNDLKESGYLDAAARRILVSWRKGDRRLVTVVKCNKGRENVTVELPGDHGGKYGLLSLTEGREVDFQSEAKAAAEAKQAAKQSNSLFKPNKAQPTEPTTRPDGSFKIWERK